MIQVFRFYRIIISPVFDYLTSSRVVCRYSPSCSEYTEQAIEKYGAPHGLWVGIKRLVRCSPWSRGGYDPLVIKNLKIKIQNDNAKFKNFNL